MRFFDPDQRVAVPVEVGDSDHVLDRVRTVEPSARNTSSPCTTVSPSHVAVGPGGAVRASTWLQRFDEIGVVRPSTRRIPCRRTSRS
jgi:hypothetical protein